ncbi:MAG: MTH1187 family thiamine-binding protein [Deltaproteobacteria bacterium]|nr:MTH1187 family thiamine-binding protein [Deltaproteobacteria bacterium]
MLAEFSITPIGTGESVGDVIAAVIRLVDESGLPYRANPMGTVVEGEWDTVMALLKKCHDEAMKVSPRVVSHVAIDMRPSKPNNRLTEKLKGVERRLGRKVRT